MKLTSRNGKLWITFYHQSQRYRRSLELDDTKANRKRAEQHIIPEIVYKLNQGMFFENENTKEKMPTVAEFAEVSFKLHKHNRKQSTLTRMMSNYKRHILPSFGNVKLDKVRPSHISLWQNRLLTEENLSPNRIRDIRTVLSVILEDAVRDEIIASNPVKKAAPLPYQAPPKIEPFTFEEINAILKHANDHFKNLFAVGFFTGMRIGEILGLRWEDINFDNSTINVQRTVGRGIVSKPKTAGSIREIEILDTLHPYLKDQFKRTGKQNSFVFLNEAETHYFDPSKVRAPHWEKALKAAKVPYRTIYQMRHTFASMMISNGEDVLWVSHMLGHTTPEMTLKRYTRYIKRDRIERGNFLKDKISA
jgi:integrase